MVHTDHVSDTRDFRLIPSIVKEKMQLEDEILLSKMVIGTLYVFFFILSVLFLNMKKSVLTW